MPEKPYISQGASTGDDLYSMGAFSLGIGTFNPAEIINPGDTGLFAGFEPVMEAISTPNPGGVLLETKTASGAAPLLISDAAKNQIWSLLTNIKPVQDLHGYANPWPAGGGVNKFDIDDLWENGTEVTTSGGEALTYIAIPVTSGTNYTVSTDVINNTNVNIASVFVTDTTQYNPTSSDDGVFLNRPKTINPSGNYLYIWIRTASSSYLAWNQQSFAPYHIQVELGSTATTWTPYSNVCPITGWTGCNVYVSPTPNAADATVYPCAWQDEAGTVYGGQIDVATGWMEVTHVVHYPTAVTGMLSNPTRAYVTQSNALMKQTNAIALCDRLKSGNDANADYSLTQYGGGDLAYFFRLDDSYASADDYNTWLSNYNMQVVLVLRTSQYYQVPHTNIFTLDGRNYIWSDCGDQITVQYAAVK